MSSRIWRTNEPPSVEVTEDGAQLERKWLGNGGTHQQTEKARLGRVHIAWLQPRVGLEKEKPWASGFQELRRGRKKGWDLGSLPMVHHSSSHILLHICPGLQTVQTQWVHPDVKRGLCVRVMCHWGFIYDIKWTIALLNAEGGATHARGVLANGNEAAFCSIFLRT